MSTVNEEIKRIKDAKTAIKASIERKGVTVPTEAHLEEYAVKIDEIQTGGGGEPILYMKDFPKMKLARSGYTEIPKNIILDGITNADHMFYESYSLKEIPSFDSSKCTLMSGMCAYMPNTLKKVGRLDVSKVTTMSGMFSSTNAVNEIYFTGGMLPNCTVDNDFPSSSNNMNGTFFYDLPYDYTPVLTKLKPTWKAQPLGNVPLKIRVLKDSSWLFGDKNLTINGKKLNYVGKGLYEVEENITKDNYLTKSTELQLDGVKIGDIVWDVKEQKLLTGDNSSLHKVYAGADILTLATENDGWAYDETYGGVVSKVITHSGKTSMTLSINSTFDMIYGQRSEQNYDFCDAYNSIGAKIWSAKGIKTEISGSVNATLTTDTSVRFTYHKDGSGSQEPDRFWIKEISFTNFPPYPEV